MTRPLPPPPPLRAAQALLGGSPGTGVQTARPPRGAHRPLAGDVPAPPRHIPVVDTPHRSRIYSRRVFREVLPFLVWSRPTTFETRGRGESPGLCDAFASLPRDGAGDVQPQPSRGEFASQGTTGDRVEPWSSLSRMCGDNCSSICTFEGNTRSLFPPHRRGGERLGVGTWPQGDSRPRRARESDLWEMRAAQYGRPS